MSALGSGKAQVSPADLPRLHKYMLEIREAQLSRGSTAQVREGLSGWFEKAVTGRSNAGSILGL
jgi:hypothetical protein